MASPDAKEALQEAKGVAAQFLGTVGLVDVVLGVLMLYGLGTVDPEGARAFRSTGSVLTDQVLMLCAAALTGKVVYLIASLMAAIFPVMPRYKKELSRRVKIYEDRHPIQGEDPEGESRLEDRALAHLHQEKSAAAEACVRVRDAALFAFGGAAVTGMLSLANCWTHALTPLVSGLALVLTVLLVFVGWLTYNDFVSQLYLALRTYAKASKEGGS
jgi:hypothetical protein